MTKLPRETPPSEREALREEDRKKRESEMRSEAEKLRRAMAVTFASADGKIVLEWIRKKCRHNVQPFSVDSLTRPCPEMTLYISYQQALYLDLRKLIPWEILKEVEYDADQKQV